MSNQELMSWCKPRKSWRRMHKGTIYEVSCKALGAPSQRELSWRLANEWWKTKQHELDNVVPDALAERQRILLEWSLVTLKLGLDDWRVERMKESMSMQYADLFVKQVETASKIALQRLSSPLVGDVIDHRQEYFTMKQNAMLSVSGLSQMRKSINAFHDWLAGRKIDSQSWSEWFVECGRRYKADNYRKRIWFDCRAFVEWLHEASYIEKPRNLRSKHFRIQDRAKAIIVWDADEITKVWQALEGESRLHFLLMLNCGMYGQDISDLLNDEIDETAQTLTRKRSKTDHHENVPVVKYKLWDETWELLMKYRVKDRPNALLHKDGKTWLVSETIGDKGLLKDRIRIGISKAKRHAGVAKETRMLRHTSATMLGTHTQYKFYGQYFLGHAPQSIAERHYIKPNDIEFFTALDWLRQQYAF